MKYDFQICSLIWRLEQCFYHWFCRKCAEQKLHPLSYTDGDMDSQCQQDQHKSRYVPHIICDSGLGAKMSVLFACLIKRVSKLPLYQLVIPEILFDLHSWKKSESNPHILKDDFRKMQSRYKNYQQIYTDGSKENSKVGCAVISDNHSNMQRIPDDSSIFTAEAKAIDLALDFISTCDANNKFIIFSDSLSVLKAMNHTSSKNPQIQKLLEKCHELLANKEIALCWIPSHIGIQGNEMVDKQAKTSLSLEPTSFKIPFSNFKPSINKYILEEWQTSWNNSIGNKLLDIKPTIGECQSVVRNIRREEVVLARLRLGHTGVTHSYLLQGEEHPQCVGCDAPFTVRHFLLECGDFAQVRNNCFHVDTA